MQVSPFACVCVQACAGLCLQEERVALGGLVAGERQAHAALDESISKDTSFTFMLSGDVWLYVCVCSS